MTAPRYRIRPNTLLRHCRVPAALLGLALMPLAAAAEPLPMPKADFALKAGMRSGASLDLAHSNGHLRVEMTKPGVPATMTGFIDLADRRITLLVPAVPNMAVEMDVPLEYSVGALAAEGEKTGETDTVTGESCELWQVPGKPGTAIGPTTLCITADGITLRTQAQIKGKTHVIYEVTQLTRAPQPPDLFRLPEGVQVMKVPKGGVGGIPPALLGLGLGGGAKAP